MSDIHQFYPTRRILANKMWDKFNNQDFYSSDSFLLDPQAGNGDLLAPKKRGYGHYDINADVIEIDFNRQAVLREKGYPVVGHDFLQFQCGKIYTHIIMNPPFNKGALHVLKGWEILKNGELISLVNAENVRNPKGATQELLVKVIEDNNGTIEYLENEFNTYDSERKTDVEVAIIHLEKKDDLHLDFLEDLRPDISDTKLDEVTEKNELAIPNGTIKQAVVVFNAAATALLTKISVTAQVSSDYYYYSGLLSDSILKTPEEIRADALQASKESAKNHDINAQYNKEYDELKERAWSHILTKTEAGNNISKKVYDSLLANFKDVSKLDFTESNIHGFLMGLIQQRGNMNMEMVLDVFDEITRYHTDNRCYYKGWKSNDKHKTNAYRVKMTRFIMPLGRSYYSDLLYDSDIRNFRDFDLAFSVLDGHNEAIGNGVYDALSDSAIQTRLQNGERVTTEYFDIRAYWKANTIHFFPRNKKLIDRLNRMVGRERQWLPPEDERVSKEFWLQFDKAEEINRTLEKDSEFKRLSSWDISNQDISEHLDKALSQHGIDPKKAHQVITKEPGTAMVAA